MYNVVCAYQFRTDGKNINFIFYTVSKTFIYVIIILSCYHVILYVYVHLLNYMHKCLHRNIILVKLID